MILGIDIGNTSIEFAMMLENGEVFCKHRIVTEKTETAAVYYENNINDFAAGQKVSGVIISSVVPEINDCLNRICIDIFGFKPLFVSCKLNTGLKIRYDNPESLGADLITAAAGAVKKYGSPLIVVDIGTATTFSVVNGKNEYLGGMIAPGPYTSMKALASMASQLPEIEMTASPNVIGTNTADCMKIGTITAHSAMTDGMIDRVKRSLALSDITVIATGGFAGLITEKCRNKIICDENLIFAGMYEIYKMNPR